MPAAACATCRKDRKMQHLSDVRPTAWQAVFNDAFMSARDVAGARWEMERWVRCPAARAHCARSPRAVPCAQRVRQADLSAIVPL